MNLLIFILAAWGLTLTLVDGKIFDSIRPEYEFYHCPMCVGFHSGWILFLAFEFSGLELFGNLWIGWFVFGCIGSAVSHALIVILPMSMGSEYDNMHQEDLKHMYEELQKQDAEIQP